MSAITLGGGAATAWAWKGRYWPDGCRLRRNSRLIVEAARPNFAAIAVEPRPVAAKSAIWTRSSSDRNLAEITRVERRSNGGTTLTVPSFNLTVVPFFQVWPVFLHTPTFHISGPALKTHPHERGRLIIEPRVSMSLNAYLYAPTVSHRVILLDG